MNRILIADDQRLFADMLKTIIQTYEGFEVVAYAYNGHSAFLQYVQHKPDICLLDIQMPNSDGIYALKQIKAVNCDAKVIMLTTFCDDENIISAYLNDADGYISKDTLPDALIDSMKCVIAGLSVMDKCVQTLISAKLHEQKDITNPEMQEAFPDTEFDERDIQIICLIAKGLSNRTIAEKMNYSEGTIRNRISKILSMTGLNDRTQVALFAIKNRLV